MADTAICYIAPAPTVERGSNLDVVGRFWHVDPVTGVSTAVDPTTVTFTIGSPTGGEQTFTNASPQVTHPMTGVYVLALGPQLPVGIYRANVAGGGSVVAQAPDEAFEVIDSALNSSVPPPQPVIGPCANWISGEDVAACAKVAYGSNPSVFDTVAFEAGNALYEISDRRFPGLCQRKVRPCRDDCSCWLTGPVSYGMGPWFWTSVPWGFGGGWAWYNERGDKFGCQPMSKVRLAGYPVSKIVEVKVDGTVMPEFDPVSGARNWRLDKWRYLVRMDAPGTPSQPRFWPSCQSMSLDDDQPGTFAITYVWGTDVPQLGRDAAVEVANQLWIACGGKECQLPAGVTRLQRQGVTVERGLLANWMDETKGTGLVHLDLFLNAYAHGKKAGRKPALWSPDIQAFGRRVGVNER